MHNHCQEVFYLEKKKWVSSTFAKDSGYEKLLLKNSRCIKKQIQTTVKGSGKGAAAAGGLAFAGGLIGGPLGIAVGGAVGGLLGCWMTSGQFKPLPQIIMELSPQQQQKLYDGLMAVLGDVQWTDLAQLTALVMGNTTLRQQLTATLLGYVSKELQGQVHYVD